MHLANGRRQSLPALPHSSDVHLLCYGECIVDWKGPDRCQPAIRKGGARIAVRHIAVGLTPRPEKELPRLPAGCLQVLIECLTRQIRQFEFDGVSGLLLSNRRAEDERECLGGAQS
jgi:hypothetical protein